ncbi:hypothetical protein AB0N09_26980 [Streptomyces erythrochromogenes]|uniref:hypothetical protein n=1 Tax=Streptomyces erythrochromogenes TaxID=285574 RepID=UPI00343A1BA4
MGETEGDWAGPFVGIEALTAQPSMRQAWLRGLRHIAPADVLVRLLDVVDTSVVLDLPTEVVDAVIAHPARGIRLLRDADTAEESLEVLNKAGQGRVPGPRRLETAPHRRRGNLMRQRRLPPRSLTECLWDGARPGRAMVSEVGSVCSFLYVWGAGPS